MQKIIGFIKYAMLILGVTIAFGLGLLWPALNNAEIQAWPWQLGAAIILTVYLIERVAWPMMKPIIRRTGWLLKWLTSTVLFISFWVTRPLR